MRTGLDVNRNVVAAMAQCGKERLLRRRVHDIERRADSAREIRWALHRIGLDKRPAFQVASPPVPSGSLSFSRSRSTQATGKLLTLFTLPETARRKML